MPEHDSSHNIPGYAEFIGNELEGPIVMVQELDDLEIALFFACDAWHLSPTLATADRHDGSAASGIS